MPCLHNRDVRPQERLRRALLILLFWWVETCCNKGKTSEKAPLKPQPCLGQKISFSVFPLFFNFLLMQICQVDFSPITSFDPTDHPTGSLTCPLQRCACYIISLAFSVIFCIRSSSQFWIH